jgi:hypothetical protein
MGNWKWEGSFNKGLECLENFWYELWIQLKKLVW